MTLKQSNQALGTTTKTSFNKDKHVEECGCQLTDFMRYQKAYYTRLVNQTEFMQYNKDALEIVDPFIHKPFDFYGSHLDLNSHNKLNIATNSLLVHEKGLNAALSDAVKVMETRCQYLQKRLEKKLLKNQQLKKKVAGADALL